MHRPQFGLSLVEFTATVMLLGVAALLSAPLLYKVVNDQRTSQYVNELVAALTYARNQSVSRGQPVAVCSSSNGHKCSDTPWAAGYIVFVDGNRDGVADASAAVLRHWPAAPNVIITLQGGRYVRFSPLGMLDSARRDLTNSRSNSWFSGLLFIGAAHAETLPIDSRAERGASAMEADGHSVFLVCYREIGRWVSLSISGRISTRPAACSEPSALR